MVDFVTLAGAAMSGMEKIRQADETIEKVKKTGGEAAREAIEWKNILKGSSLVEASQAARAEPITLVESTLVDDKITQDALSVALNAFAGFYVMTASMLTANVNGASVVRTLDRLSPKRSVINSLVYSGETHYTARRLPRTLGETGLEAYEEDRAELGTSVRDPNPDTGLESNDEDDQQQKDDNATVRNAALSFGKNTGKDLQDKANLSLGKMVEVSMGTSKDNVSVFVNFRLAVQIVPPALLEVILIPARNRTIKQRYHAWRAGELSLWGDIVMMRDVVEHHRKVRMADTKGLRREIDKRMSGNRAAAALSKTGSLNMFSSISVITRETARKIEQGIGGKLDNFRIRDKFFEENGMMMLMVVDRDYQMVDIYYHSIPEKSEMTSSNLRGASKGTGPELDMIMDALVKKSAPSF